MPDAGDVVTLDFPGVQKSKRRPAIVLSSSEYHSQRPDIIVGLLTSQISKATSSTDHVLVNWRAANLTKPSAFRSYLWTVPQSPSVALIGKLDPADWQAIKECLKRATAFT